MRRRRPFIRRWVILGLSLASLALAAAGWSGWWSYQENLLRDELKQAQLLFRSGRTATARTFLQGLASRWPESSEVHFLIGECELALNRPDLAEASFRRVAPNSEVGPEALVRMAQLCLRRDQLGEVERLILSLREDGNPATAIEAALLYGGCLVGQGRVDEARSHYREHFDQINRPIDILRDLWRVDHALKPPSVRARLERALRQFPDDDRVRLGLAHLATLDGRVEEATRLLDLCEAHAPSDPAIARLQLQLALATGQTEAARRAIGRLPENALPPGRVWELSAWFARQRSDPLREQDALLKALEAGEVDRQAILERLAVLAYEAGDPEKAAALRKRRSECNEAYRLYYEYIFSDQPGRHASELARLANVLGWTFEARQWERLATGREPADSALARNVSAEGESPTLATLKAELDKQMPAPTGIAPKNENIRLTSTLPVFQDIASSAGLRFTYDPGRVAGRPMMGETSGGGVALLDFDRDGWLDVFLPQGGTFPPVPDAPSADRLFRNRGDGTFVDVSEQAGLSDIPGGYGMGCAVGDYDGDGHVDILVTRWRTLLLLRNRGDGTFEDATAPSGLSSPMDWPTSAAFADLDKDGDLDLYVCNYLHYDPLAFRAADPSKSRSLIEFTPLSHPSLPDRLYRNDGGRFTDVSEESGIAAADTHGRGLGVVAADLDEDGRIDLYVANDLTANFLFLNRGGLRFDESAEVGGVAAGGDGALQASMGIGLGDQNGDGLADLVVTNFLGEGAALYRNMGGGGFSEQAASSGLLAPTRSTLGFGIALFDANLDGALDLAIANGHINDLRPRVPFEMPQQLLLGTPGGRFFDVTEEAGPVWSKPRIGRGLAIGDLDNDGRLDAILLFHDAPVAYLRNQTPRNGQFLVLDLRATATAPSAEGACVQIQAEGRRFTSWRYGGGSYASGSDPRLHFGLGPNVKNVLAEVRWPSGRIDRFPDLPSNSAWRLTEGQATPEPLAGYPPGSIVAETP